MLKLKDYKISEDTLQLYLEIDAAKYDFSSEFSKEFFKDNYDKIKNEVVRIIRKNKIKFSKGKVKVIVNGTLISSLVLLSGCQISESAATHHKTEGNYIVTVEESSLEENSINKEDIIIEEETVNEDKILEEEAIVENIIVDSSEQLKEMKLVLISGHANINSDPGAVYNKRYEYAYSQELVNMVTSELEKKDNVNINVILEPDVMALAGEMAFLKGTTANYAISIHFNAGGGSGSEVIVPFASSDLTIATEVINNFKQFNQPIRKTAIYSRSAEGKVERKNNIAVPIQKEYYGIVRAGYEMNIPSDIIEIEFIDNEENMKFYDANKIKYAKAIADAIEQYYLKNFSS